MGAARPAPQRHQDFGRHGTCGPRQIGGPNRIAIHIDAGNKIRPLELRIARAFCVIVEQRFGRFANGNSRIRGRSHRGDSHQSRYNGGQQFFVILLRLLHCNIPRYFVTGPAKHSINKPLKNSLKRVVAKSGQVRG